MMVAASVSGLYLLAALACPVGMGAMMWFMMKGSGHKRSPSFSSPEAQHLSELKAEQARLAARIEALESDGQADDAGDSVYSGAKTPVG